MVSLLQKSWNIASLLFRLLPLSLDNTKAKQQVKQTLDISKLNKSPEMEALEILNKELRNFIKEMGKMYDKHNKLDCLSLNNLKHFMF